MTDTKAKVDLLLKEPPPKREPAAAAIYTYQATSAEQYLGLLHQTDPRPWWHEAAPRKKARLKNVRLTNTLSSSATTPSEQSAASGEITSRNRRANHG
jgi:hypothetical protein